MTAPSSAVVSVHTTDATPDVANFKVSNRAGEDTATVTLRFSTGSSPLRPGVGVRPGLGRRPSDGAFEVGGAIPGGDLTPDMEPYVAAYRLTSGATRNVGPLVANLGCVCGLDRCGVPGVMPLRMKPRVVDSGPIIGPINGARVGAPTTFLAARVTVSNVTELVAVPEFHGALVEGDNTINVFALVEPEGWI